MALQKPGSQPPERWTADTRALNIFAIVVVAIALISIAAWTYGAYSILNDPLHAGRNLDIDFSVYWAAAKFALDGNWLAPFDTAKLNEARLIPLERTAYEMLWFYPPSYHILIAPLGYLSFFWSWLAFCTVSILALALAVWLPARRSLAVTSLVIFSPSALFVLALGQNSLLIVALLVGAIEALRRERFVLAGLLIAAMTIKPQLGLAIPVALVAGGYWRTIAWATLGTLFLVGSTILFLGPEYWIHFFQAVVDGGDKMRYSDLVNLMISGFGNAVSFGLEQEAAMIFQIALACIAAICLTILWRNREISFDRKAAGLCVSVLLMTPYAVHYELIFVVRAALYLALAGALESITGRYLIVTLWLSPAIGYVLLPAPGFVFTGPLFLLTVFYCLSGVSSRQVDRADYGMAR